MFVEAVHIENSKLAEAKASRNGYGHRLLLSCNIYYVVVLCTLRDHLRRQNYHDDDFNPVAPAEFHSDLLGKGRARLL